MDFYAHEKTPRMLAPRQDGSCPFCLTPLHVDALVCSGCGAHKWHNSDIYRPSKGDLLFKIIYSFVVIAVTAYTPSVLDRVVDAPTLWWGILCFVLFLWLALVAHIEEFIRAIRNPIDGTVWRRKR